jgi:3-hydroxyisobutyrate dehydrogenase-like beta-hydroxyacid dehydrogenase
MPQKAWSAKRERQYDHIEESLEERGTPKRKAKEIAARTVNKTRAQTGEAKESSKLSRKDMSPARRCGLRSGTNRPKGRTKEQLYNEAKRMGIDGRSKMSKQQLQRAVDRRK